MRRIVLHLRVRRGKLIPNRNPEWHYLPYTVFTKTYWNLTSVSSVVSKVDRERQRGLYERQQWVYGVTVLWVHCTSPVHLKDRGRGRVQGRVSVVLSGSHLLFQKSNNVGVGRSVGTTETHPSRFERSVLWQVWRLRTRFSYIINTFWWLKPQPC